MIAQRGRARYRVNGLAVTRNSRGLFGSRPDTSSWRGAVAHCIPGKPGPRETYSRSPEPAEGIDPRQSMTGGVLIPSMVVKQRGESEAGRMQTVGVSAPAFAALLTNADPDAVKGACELQRVHCPATFQGRA